MKPTPALRMQVSRVLRASGLDPKNGVYLGGWGNLGSQPQKGVTTYALSANRQQPMAGAYYNAIFNVSRRTYHQIFYWLPPFILGYALMEWATERNEYLNSKPGRMETAEAEAASGGE